MPVFSETAPSFCSYHQLVDHLGTTLLAVAIDHHALARRHNASCDIICFALLEDNSEVLRERGVSGESASIYRSGDVFIQIFIMVTPHIVIFVEPSFWCFNTLPVSPGFPALRGEMEKYA